MMNDQSKAVKFGMRKIVLLIANYTELEPALAIRRDQFTIGTFAIFFGNADTIQSLHNLWIEKRMGRGFVKFFGKLEN